MKKIVLSLCCLLFATLSFAKAPEATYKGMAYAPGHINLGKMGIYPTDVIIINNTTDSITVSAPGVYRDYLGGNGVYRLTSTSSIAPEVILRHYAYGVVFDRFVQPHSIISFSIQSGTANTISVEYY